MDRVERVLALLLLGTATVMLGLVVAELGGLFGPFEWTAVLALVIAIAGLAYRLRP